MADPMQPTIETTAKSKGSPDPARAKSPITPSPLLAARLPEAADLSNVVLFNRLRPTAKQGLGGLALSAGDRPAPPSAAAGRPANVALLLGLSLALHAGLVFALNREPAPLASIGIVSISVDIVLGADDLAGLAQVPSPSEAPASSAISASEKNDAEEPPASDRVPPRRDIASEQPRAETIETIAQVENRVARPQAVPPAHASEQPRNEGKKAHQHAATAPSLASSGVGRGRSDAETTYRGLVAAHLARYKQYPAEARSRGEHGVATVFFTIDADGRVTSVKLVRASGVSSLDRETQAMVQRASPFPTPSSGRPMRFIVPVGFHLN